MKKAALFIGFLLFLSSFAGAQVQRQKIAIFTPMYLDSVMDAGGNFRFEKNNFPRFVVPGLEFYLGAQLALDSLQKGGAPLEVFLLDSRGRQPIAQQLQRPDLRDLGLIIGQSNAAETKLLAEVAEKRKIPFISATLPNDAGISNNPYFVVLNTTLQSHVEGIYRFLQKHHSLDRIIVFRKSGAQEEQIRETFTEFTKNTLSTPLNIKFVDVSAGINAQTLAAQLDSNKRNVCIAGSLDEAFGAKLTAELAPLTTRYPVRVIGMPTWERMSFAKLQNLEIIYTSPFNYNRGTALGTKLTEEFSNRMSGKPSDLFFRGYEATMRFALLLLDTKADIGSGLSRKGNTVFTPFDIQPVFKDKTAMTLDYFENKHLYFVKVFGGVKNILY